MNDGASKPPGVTGGIPASPSGLTAEVRARALRLGFDLCRATTAEAPTSGKHFRTWIEQGRHGELAYLARNAAKRVDPQQVLPGARSILCLAASYHRNDLHDQDVGPHGSHVPFGGARLLPSPRWIAGRVARQQPRPTEGGRFMESLRSDERGPATGPGGIVARYARFADYHEVLASKLRELAAFLDERGGAGARSLWYVDTGPVLERDLAQRAGLGFIGKHTNLISRTLGNWIFLAEILTTVELVPDPPERNRCGSCARCLAACPTGAIVEPFMLDARRCISYLTIELKGPIPVELRPALGTRIFGCDDCLEVCPWNRFAREGRLMREAARPELEAPDLIELLGLDEAAFKARFIGTPIARAKRRGLLRNVCVALGNLGHPAALPALARAANDPEPLIAEHARWAIERIEGVAAGQPG